MKKLYTILVLSIVLNACTTPKGTPPSLNLAVVTDITDKRVAYPDRTALYTHVLLDKNPSKEVFIGFYPITNMLLNNSFQLHLPNATETEKENVMSDRYYRNKRILAFYNEVDTTLGLYKKCVPDTTLNESECYKTIARIIQRMEQKKSTENVLLVYSDLLENSSMFNSYKKKQLTENDTTIILKAFKHGEALPQHLENFKIIFVFQPMNKEEEKRFMIFYTVYESLLRAKGAMVELQTNNNLNQ